MKRFYKIASGVEHQPSRLLASVALAFIVMTFINGFVGSMGGFPAFLAFVCCFFLLRTIAGEKTRITHHLAMTSKQEIGYLLWDYSAGYLLLWGILRLAFLFSRVSGWGNINGSSALQFVQQMWELSLFEKWAYLFAGIVMFTFVLSLFPLVVIREKTRFIRYALIDAAVFALACLGIGTFCNVRLEQDTTSRATCLVDHLLLCGELKAYQEALCITGMVLFTLAVGVFVFWYAAKQYGPVPGHVNLDFQKENKKTKKVAFQRLVAIGCSVAAVCVVILIVLFMPKDTTGDYVKVAQYLTKDTSMAPMEYGGTIYLPVNENPKLDETGTPQGYLADKKERCDSRFYQLAVANLLYTDPTGKTDLVQTAGVDAVVYAPAQEVETAAAWKADEVFLLWDEEWESESAYSHEPTGYSACTKDFVQGLYMQFSDATYHVSDFSDYDAYFTIYGYLDMDQALEKGPQTGDWVGCILVKDNKFYFCNYENQITGICLQQLRDVLGGNSK